MENRGRRARRRYQSHQCAPASSFGIKNVIFTAGIVCLAFSVLQYNCRHCHAKQELMKLTSSVDDIAKQLNTIQNSYQSLEDKLVLCSQKLPKLEKQIAVLGTLAQMVEANRFGWNPQVQTMLPYVDVNLRYMNKTRQNLSTVNATKTSKILSTIIIKQPKSLTMTVTKDSNKTL